MFSPKRSCSERNTYEVVCNLACRLVSVPQVVRTPVDYKSVWMLFDQVRQHVMVEVLGVGTWEWLDLCPAVSQIGIELLLPDPLEHAI